MPEEPLMPERKESSPTPADLNDERDTGTPPASTEAVSTGATDAPPEAETSVQVATDNDATPAGDAVSSSSEATTDDVASGDSTASPAKENGSATTSASVAAEGASADFEKLLDSTPAGDAPREVKVGERVRGKIVSIDEEQTFVDFSGRSEASIATSELRGTDGKVLLRVGDMLSATVASVDEGVALTLGKKRAAVNAAKLRVAHEEGIPVSGTIKSINKGGFEVKVGGVRAFCPLSQIERAFVQEPNEYVGKTFSFNVIRWENGGRNIVVSRRSILEKEAREKAVETRKSLAVDAEFDGVVTRIQPFGAFVDLGGIEGLLHISRMGHGHIEDPKSVVAAGQPVRVRVVHLENEGTSKERVALALADLGPDPWDDITATLTEGEVVEGKVARLTPFGAFVRLANGIDGLVHVSEIAYQRINDPKDVLSSGEEVSVRILKVDAEKRRVSLSIRQASGEAPPASASPKRERPPRNPRTRDSGGGVPQSKGPLTHNMADQLGALKQRFESND